MAAHERAETRRLAIAACQLCDDQGYVGTVVCPHDPGQADRARQRAAEARNHLAGLAGGPRCDGHPNHPRDNCPVCRRSPDAH
jgi:hypothetical protein